MMMNVSEHICPVCETPNELEAVVCSHCGAKLDPFIESGHETKTTDMQALSPEVIKEWSLNEAKDVAVPDSGIAFYVDGHSKAAHIDSRAEFVLGRNAGTTSDMLHDLVDLAPFGGYSLGLSRRHVVIRRTGNGYEVLDLGSVNGTWLNEERLIPHKSYPMPGSSYLRLGRMRIFVLYRSFAETK